MPNAETFFCAKETIVFFQNVGLSVSSVTNCYLECKIKNKLELFHKKGHSNSGNVTQSVNL